MADENKDARELSRQVVNMPFTVDGINMGSLQRIADACEKMCQDREGLERRLKSMEESRDRWWSQCECEKYSNRALRGVITKLKRRLKDAEG